MIRRGGSIDVVVIWWMDGMWNVIMREEKRGNMVLRDAWTVMKDEWVKGRWRSTQIESRGYHRVV